ERHHAAVVAVRFLPDVRMMHRVDARGDDEPAQEPVDRAWNPQIRMRPESYDRGSDEIGADSTGWKAECHNQRHQGRRADGELEGVVAFRRGDVELRVAMVDQVQSPEEPNPVEQVVLPIPPQIQE